MCAGSPYGLFHAADYAKTCVDADFWTFGILIRGYNHGYKQSKNLIEIEPVILNSSSVESEPIVTTPKHIRRYELSALRAINHARQNKHVLPFGLVRSIHALKINKNRRKIKTRKPGSSKYRPRGINCSNLIEIATDFKELKFFHTTKVKLGLINAQSMKNKETTLLDHITKNDLDFLIITETWLTDSIADSQWKTTSQLATKPLRLLSQNRDG